MDFCRYGVLCKNLFNGCNWKHHPDEYIIWQYKPLTIKIELYQTRLCKYDSECQNNKCTFAHTDHNFLNKIFGWCFYCKQSGHLSTSCTFNNNNNNNSNQLVIINNNNNDNISTATTTVSIYDSEVLNRNTSNDTATISNNSNSSSSSSEEEEEEEDNTEETEEEEEEGDEPEQPNQNEITTTHNNNNDELMLLIYTKDIIITLQNMDSYNQKDKCEDSSCQLGIKCDKRHFMYCTMFYLKQQCDCNGKFYHVKAPLLQ